MMGKTHLTVGIATALAVTLPNTVEGCMLAVIGGGIGGVLADVDILDNDYKHDALIGELLAFGLTGLCFLLDWIFGFGLVQRFASGNTIMLASGGVLFLILWGIGFCTDHRTFTHSLLALVLFTGAAFLLCQSLWIPFATGYASHLMLDVLNKKPVPLLYPLKGGICLKLCYASKIGNTVIMIVGLIASMGLLSVCLFVSTH